VTAVPVHHTFVAGVSRQDMTVIFHGGRSDKPGV
jgi:hypothetical protein